MLDGPIPEGLTFDDVLLVPNKSAILPTQVDTRTRVTRHITLNIPIVSAAMDTVTESRLAIALAQQGGIGIVHRSMSIAQQAMEVDKVKRSESGMIVDPVTIGPKNRIADALEIMKKYKISGVPVTQEGKLVGILTNRDLRFEDRFDLPVEDVMTKENLVTVAIGTTLEEAEGILHKHRVEKLLVVDKDYNLRGLITVKDIQKKIKYPNACKDEQGRLRVGAALGATGDYLERAAELVKAKVDLLVVDTAHGHSTRVLDAVQSLKEKFPNVDLVAGNVATFNGACDLIQLGVDGVKVGIGPGSICTTRVVTGAGVPQITAIAECTRAASKAGVPVIADGGIKFSGDVSKAIAAGASSVMLGQPVCRHGRKPRRDRSLPGAHLQILSGHGIDCRHDRRLRRPLLPGTGSGPGGNFQTRSGRHRGARAVQRPAGGPGGATGGRLALRHGLLRLRQHRRTATARPLRAHYLRGLARKPRSRRHHHQRSAELFAGLIHPAQAKSQE